MRQAWNGHFFTNYQTHLWHYSLGAFFVGSPPQDLAKNDGQINGWLNLFNVKTLSSMTLLFYNLAPAKWHRRDVTMLAVHFWGQGSSYLIRECPTCDWKRGGGEKEHRSLHEIWTRFASNINVTSFSNISFFNLLFAFLFWAQVVVRSRPTGVYLSLY